MSSLGKLLVVLALGLMAGALILGLRPVTDERGIRCGNALSESTDRNVDELRDALEGGTGESGCDKARSDAQTLPILLGVLGVAAFAAAFVIERSGPPSGGRRTPDAP